MLKQNFVGNEILITFWQPPLDVCLLYTRPVVLQVHWAMESDNVRINDYCFQLSVICMSCSDEDLSSSL